MSAEPSPRPISEIAQHLGVDPGHLVPYGEDKAKIRLEARDSRPPRGKLILVSALTPTRAGEGKTTISIGLAQGLAKIGRKVCLALREPSLGPTFGLKGGATGGGRSIVVPQADINLHFTGDFHAISAANNLLSAMLDNHLQQGNRLGIDPRRVFWRRVMDMNDRALRHLVAGLGGVAQGIPRETGFDITPASEIMAILCLAEDAEDLRSRLSRLLVAQTWDGAPVTAADLNAVGAMMVLLKDALMPNLVQTLEGVPALIHGGPFANIAHGCNSVIATKTALAYADWVVTEAGFAFDLGGEKFFDIKCRSAGLNPSAVVIVATVKALKLHGGARESELSQADAAAVERGLPNLDKHLENVAAFGKPAVVALNRFASDSPEEIEAVRRRCSELGVPFAVADIFAQGGDGGTELAQTLVDHTPETPSPYKPLYDVGAPIKEKMATIARTIYGAREILYTQEAEQGIDRIRELGYEGIPLCVAKTPASLTDDASRVGRPQGFDITVRSIVLSAGAGFAVPLLGDILRMPGLPAKPQAELMDLVDGEVVGMR